jgi:hypothetical protein
VISKIPTHSEAPHWERLKKFVHKFRENASPDEAGQTKASYTNIPKGRIGTHNALRSRDLRFKKNPNADAMARGRMYKVRRSSANWRFVVCPQWDSRMGDIIRNAVAIGRAVAKNKCNR